MGELIGKSGLRAAVALAATLAAAALGAAAASAQQPAICTQYEGLEQCVADEGGSGGNGGSGGGVQTGSDSGAGFALPGPGGDGAAAGAAGSVVAAGGELPFTGYPLTPLIWLLLALLVAGLVLRAYLSLRDRVRPPSRVA